MRIQHNKNAMQLQRQLEQHMNEKSRIIERMTSGYRINRAADNAAGLKISEKMRSQIRGLYKASKNVQDGLSLIQIADGALGEIHNMLHRMRELSVKAVNDTNTDQDRKMIQKEIDQLKKEIDRIASTTEFNTRKLLDGTYRREVVPRYEKASYETEINFSTVINGTTITINDVLFEFDTDGQCNHSSAVPVSISASDSTQAKAEKLKAAIDSSLLSAEFNTTIENIAGDNIHIKIEATEEIDKQELKITYGNSTIPEFKKEETKLLQGGKAVKIEGIDPDTVVDGTTISLGNTVYEIDTDGHTFNQGSQVIAIDIRSTTDKKTTIYQKIREKFGNKITIAESSGLWTLTWRDNLANPLFVNKENTVSKGMIHEKEISKKGANTEGIEAIGIILQIGANEGQKVELYIDGTTTQDMGIHNLTVSNAIRASSAITALEQAIEYVSENRANLGAAQNRLEHTFNNLKVGEENTTESESRIRDTDMVKEVIELSRNNILEQVNQAMLSQINRSPEQILGLLQ